MEWIAEQKIIIKVEAETEEDARNKIKQNVMVNTLTSISTIKQFQQSWLLPMDNYWKSRFAIDE